MKQVSSDIQLAMPHFICSSMAKSFWRLRLHIIPMNVPIRLQGTYQFQGTVIAPFPRTPRESDAEMFVYIYSYLLSVCGDDICNGGTMQFKWCQARGNGGDEEQGYHGSLGL